MSTGELRQQQINSLPIPNEAREQVQTAIDTLGNEARAKLQSPPQNSPFQDVSLEVQRQAVSDPGSKPTAGTNAPSSPVPAQSSPPPQPPQQPPQKTEQAPAPQPKQPAPALAKPQMDLLSPETTLSSTLSFPPVKERFDSLRDHTSEAAQKFRTDIERFQIAHQGIQQGKGEIVPQDIKETFSWLQNVQNGRIPNPYQDPNASKHVTNLWNYGSFYYATNGYTLDPKDPEQYKQILDRLEKLHNIALGNDGVLDVNDLKLIYNNFSSSLGLNPKDYQTKVSFVEWWKNDDSSPLAKIALLLGIPLALVGMASALFKGATFGNVLLTLLGGIGALAGLSSYQKSTYPKAQIQGGYTPVSWLDRASASRPQNKQATSKYY